MAERIYLVLAEFFIHYIECFYHTHCFSVVSAFMPRFVTWNVNSIRPRLEHLLRWMKEHNPDVMLLQETKVVDNAFPFEQIEELGYNIAVHGQKTYNGVAILSKGPLEDVQRCLPGNEGDEQARFIEALTTLDGVVYRVASVYVPNGQAPDSDKFQYKMNFMSLLHRHMQQQLQYDEAYIVGGDYNVAPSDVDVYDPAKLDGTVCYHPLERDHIRTMLQGGMTDAFRALKPAQPGFSWWDYRAGAWQQDKGLRIDHLLLSPEAADSMVDADVARDVRGWEKASDHAPVWVMLQPRERETPWAYEA